MIKGGHALGRRVSELRVAQHALAVEARALEADDTYALLAGGTHHFTGTTAARAGAALARVAEVWRCLAVLDDLLGQVERRAAEVHGDGTYAAQLGTLLNSPVIVVAPDVPSLSPDELVASLPGALVSAREVVAEVEAAWRELVPRVDRAIGEAARLTVELPRLAQLVAARLVLDGLPDRIVHDPLGAADELSRVESTLASVAGARADLVRLDQATADAARTLAELERLLGEGSAALERSRAEVVRPEGMLAPVDPDVLSQGPGLRPWLERLERLVSEGEVSRASAGLERWRAVAEQTAAVARQVADANAVPWRRRQELQGLLRATRVKAGAMGSAEDPLVSELVDRATRALAVPCDLPAAESAVEALLDGLREPMWVSA